MSFPLDLPDDYPWWPGSRRFILEDMAELAARLGSPVVYDRRGQVAWFDHFAAGLSGWVTNGVGTGWAVETVAESTLFPGFAIKLTAGSTSSRYAAILKSFSSPDVGRSGVEVAVSFLSEFDKIDLMLEQFTGTTWIYGRIRIDRANNVIQYRDSSGTYQTILALPTPDTIDVAYQYAKLVIDWNLNEYVRFLYNQSEYDLSGIPLYQEANASAPVQGMTFQFFSRSGENDVCQIGSVVLTVGEP